MHVISAIAPKLGYMEDQLQAAGKLVVSISPHARTDPRNPLIVPEANFQELETHLHQQLVPESLGQSAVPATMPMIKSPNCVSCGTAVALKAIDEVFGIQGVSITTFQARLPSNIFAKPNPHCHPNFVCTAGPLWERRCQVQSRFGGRQRVPSHGHRGANGRLSTIRDHEDVPFCGPLRSVCPPSAGPDGALRGHQAADS